MAFPGTDIGSVEFFVTDLMTNYSEAVVLEGDNPLDYVDLRVFVAPAPEDGERLFVCRTRDRTSDERAKAAAFKRLLLEPAAMADFRGAPLGSSWPSPAARITSTRSAVRQWPTSPERTRGSSKTSAPACLPAFPQSRSAGLRDPGKCRPIADRCRGVERAQLDIVNLRRDDQRESGDQLLADLARLRTHEELFRDILGVRGSRVPITAVVADLAATHDPGRKKALARVRRTIRSRSS